MGARGGEVRTGAVAISWDAVPEDFAHALDVGIPLLPVAQNVNVGGLYMRDVDIGKEMVVMMRGHLLSGKNPSSAGGDRDLLRLLPRHVVWWLQGGAERKKHAWSSLGNGRGSWGYGFVIIVRGHVLRVLGYGQ